jgi:hypothetical protein
LKRLAYAAAVLMMTIPQTFANGGIDIFVTGATVDCLPLEKAGFWAGRIKDHEGEIVRGGAADQRLGVSQES